MADFYIVIPAKVNGSERLRGKPLLEVDGKPLVAWAAETALQTGASQVLVTTDENKEVAKKLPKGVDCVPMPPNTKNGTEAVWRAYESLLMTEDIVSILNLQVDEAFIPPTAISKIPSPKKDTITTLVDPMMESERYNPNYVGAVLSDNQDVLWFSRKGNHAWRHVGVYCFRSRELEAFYRLQETTLTRTTKLEQMKVLSKPASYLGYKAGISTEPLPRSINTEEDLQNER